MASLAIMRTQEMMSAHTQKIGTPLTFGVESPEQFVLTRRCVPSVTAKNYARNPRVKFDRFRGDKACQNGDNRINPGRQISVEISLELALRKFRP
jgi:hypothetical protein